MPRGTYSITTFSEHFRKNFVTLADIEARASSADLDAALSDVIDTVEATYGRFSPWELMEISHEEEIW